MRRTRLMVNSSNETPGITVIIRTHTYTYITYIKNNNNNKKKFFKKKIEAVIIIIQMLPIVEMTVPIEYRLSAAY